MPTGPSDAARGSADDRAEAGGVVVGFDGSDAARDAAALAAVLEAWAGPPRLVAVTRQGARIVEDASAPVDGAEVGPRDVASELERAARKHEARAVAVGSTHRGTLGRVYPGSVGRRLLSAASVPVAVAPRGYADQADRGLYVIGVAFDASEASFWALHLAEDVCLKSADALRVYTAVPAPQSARGSRDVAIRSAPASTRERLLTALNAAVQELDPAARALPVTLQGDAVSSLVSRSFEIDLLTIGAGTHTATEIALGASVSAELVDALACPVLVAPPGARARPDPS